MKQPKKVIIATSGKCFYGSKAFTEHDSYPVLDEDATPMGADFPSELVSRWETAAAAVDTDKVRYVQIRIGLTLGPVSHSKGRMIHQLKHGGILPGIALLFKYGLGGIAGHGKQPFPWIHIDDVVGILMHCILQKNTEGKYNAVSPGIVNHVTFCQLLAKHYHQSIRFHWSSSLITKIVSKDRVSIILQGQNITPKRTIECGYQFKFNHLEQALNDLLRVNNTFQSSVSLIKSFVTQWRKYETH